VKEGGPREEPGMGARPVATIVGATGELTLVDKLSQWGRTRSPKAHDGNSLYLSLGEAAGYCGREVSKLAVSEHVRDFLTTELLSESGPTGRYRELILNQATTELERTVRDGLGPQFWVDGWIHESCSDGPRLVRRGSGRQSCRGQPKDTHSNAVCRLAE
jgi:hypothetical protein